MILCVYKIKRKQKQIEYHCIFAEKNQYHRLDSQENLCKYVVLV